MEAAFLLDGVLVNEATQGRAVVAQAVVNEAGFGVGVLRREAEGVAGGRRAAGAQGVAEGVVFIRGGKGPRRGVDEAHHVAVAVVGHAQTGAGAKVTDVQQPAHPTRPLQRAGPIQPPNIGADERAVRPYLSKQVPAVVEVLGVALHRGVRGAVVAGADGFPHPPAQIIVHKLHAPCIGVGNDHGGEGKLGLHGDETILGVVGVVPPPIGGQVAVQIIRQHLGGRRGEAEALGRATGRGGNGQPGPDGVVQVGHIEGGKIVIVVPRDARAQTVDGHTGGCRSQAGDVHFAGIRATSILVERVGGVG